MTTETLSRRKLLGASLLALSAIPVVVETAFAQAKPKVLPELKVDDPAAKALGYVLDSTKVDGKANPMHKLTQLCSNCLQWAEKSSMPLGRCNLFPGKLVRADGWCKVYIKKA